MTLKLHRILVVCNGLKGHVRHMHSLSAPAQLLQTHEKSTQVFGLERDVDMVCDSSFAFYVT